MNKYFEGCFDLYSYMNDLFSSPKEEGSLGESSIKEFINQIEILAEKIIKENKIEEEDERNKLKGDSLEIFAEIFFNIFYADDEVGLINYTNIESCEDYGTDAIGTHSGGNRCAIQVKYRKERWSRNITYTEITNTYFDARHYHEIDVEKPNSIWIFTTANDVHHNVRDRFGPIVHIVGRELIEQKIGNNHTFWSKAYDMIFKYLIADPIQRIVDEKINDIDDYQIKNIVKEKYRDRIIEDLIKEKRNLPSYLEYLKDPCSKFEKNQSKKTVKILEETITSFIIHELEKEITFLILHGIEKPQ